MSNLELVTPLEDTNVSAINNLNDRLDYYPFFNRGMTDLDKVRVCIDEELSDDEFASRFLKDFAQKYDYAKFLSSLTDEEWFIKKYAQVEFEIVETGRLDIPDDIAQDDDKLEDYVAELDIYDYQEVLPDDADLGSTYVHRHENVQIRLTDAVISKLQDALIEEKVS